jgi:hypothetical protein
VVEERQGQLGRMGHYLLGLSDLFTLVAATLRTFGEWAISNVPNDEGDDDQ